MGISRWSVGPCNPQNAWYYTTVVNVHGKSIFPFFGCAGSGTEDVFYAQRMAALLLVRPNHKVSHSKRAQDRLLSPVLSRWRP